LARSIVGSITLSTSSPALVTARRQVMLDLHLSVTRGTALRRALTA
jgi:hypothetical protein